MHIKLMRKCVVCRESRLQGEMLRIARINNSLFIDKNYKLGGRGAYICKDKECKPQVIKKKLLNRAFKTNINQSFYKELEEYEQNN